MIQEMDKKAALLAEEILLRNFPASDQFIQVLQCIENACNGPWSQWMGAGLTDSVLPPPG
jgi:hypothetical protein